MSNNTVACEDIDELPADYWEPFHSDGECYGLINLPLCRHHGRLIDGSNYRPDLGVAGCNPCITGDTPIAVADGRGSVPINQLKKDTPVYCLDDDDNMTIRTMRHPRITGRQVTVYKITLDNGQSLRVTKNHKFLCTDGQYREVRHLSPGDGLRIMTRYVPESCTGQSRGDLYTYMAYGAYGRCCEHRQIAHFHSGLNTLDGKHVHHRDRNRLNNHPSNLLVKDAYVHLRDHSQGSNNPRYNGVTNQQLIQLGVDLCSRLGRRFSVKEWFAEGYLSNFTHYRRQSLGSVTDFADLCAELAGVASNADPRTLRVHQRMLESGLACRIRNRRVEVRKTCEACQRHFWIHHLRREQACCSFSCANTLRDYTKARDTLRQTIEAKQSVIRRHQLDVFTRLQATLGRTPQRKEWQQACRDMEVSPEISRKSSPFRTWRALCEAGSEYNHRVVSIVEDGVEDVWNGTVDEYHNFFLGCFDEGVNKYGRHRWVMVNSPNCGEASLENREPCNLAEIFLPRIQSVAEWLKIARLLVKATKTIANYRYSDPATGEVVHRNMRIGISLSGWMMTPKNMETLDYVYQSLERADAAYSEELGVPPSVKLTTIKPSGTLSLLPGVTPGIHAAFNRFLIRRIRFPANNPLVGVCRQHGFRVEPEMTSDGFDSRTMVVEFPVDMGDVITEDRLSATAELETQKALQTWWADQSISCSHYFRRDEVDDIKDWLRHNYRDSVKTCSFMHAVDHGFRQAPLEAITEEQYATLIAKVKPISQLTAECERYLTSGSDILEADCEGGCPIK